MAGARSPDDALAKQARQDARRERNRVAAQNSRDRKLQDFQRLTDENAALREEVADLRQRLAAYEPGGGAGPSNGAPDGAGGSASKRKRINVKPLHKKAVARRAAYDDEEDAVGEEDELFDLDEAPRSSPRPDDSIFGINRVGSALAGLKASYLGGSPLINSSPVASPRLGALDTDDDVAASPGPFAAAPPEGQDQILQKIGLADPATPGTPRPQGRGHRIKRPKVEM